MLHAVRYESREKLKYSFKIWLLLVTFSAFYLNTPLVLFNHLIDK